MAEPGAIAPSGEDCRHKGPEVDTAEALRIGDALTLSPWRGLETMSYLIRSCRALLLLAAPALLVLLPAAAQAQSPIRGDSNGDQKIDISDPIHVLNYLFAGGKAPSCTPAADANADSKLDISDAVTTLSYLFSGRGELPPLTSYEANECAATLRRGRLIDVLDPGHAIDGRVEELSTRVIRVRDFTYDGLGDPQVVVLLTKARFDNQGVVISGDLRRDQPYAMETLELSLPDGVSPADFNFVAIWCDAFPLTFAYAELSGIP